MNGYIVAVASAVLLLVFMVELLRRRRLREKYAALWIIVSLVVLVAVAVPGLFEGASRVVGITVPLNLVFFGALLLLLFVCIQLSAELTQLERESQTLAEEIAILKNRVEVLERSDGGQHPDVPQNPGRGGGAAE